MPGFHHLSGAPSVARRSSIGGLFGIGILLAANSGCNDSDLRAFREAAANGLEQGVGAIFDGIVSGAFAVFSQGTDAASTGGTDTSSGDTGSDTGTIP